MIKTIKFIFYSFLITISSFINTSHYFNLYAKKFDFINPLHTGIHIYAKLPYKNNYNITKPNLLNYSATQLANYFAYHGYTEQDILMLRTLYISDEFIKLAKTYDGYKDTIIKLHNEFHQLNYIHKLVRICTGTYHIGLKKRLCTLYKEICNNNHIIKPKNTSSKKELFNIYSLKNEITEYQLLYPLFQKYSPTLASNIEKRLNKFNQINNNNTIYKTKKYIISNNALIILQNTEYDIHLFTNCSGNKYQHIIHQEAIDIIECISYLPHKSIFYKNQDLLLDYAITVFQYNHAGLTHKAIQIADLCWTLLDYGKAILEGTTTGTISAIKDIVEHPLQSLSYIIMGDYILAYQLYKVAYNIADITLTSLIDPLEAKKKWEDYIKPIDAILVTIQNKEITIQNAIKSCISCTVYCTIQGKVLNGLKKFYSDIKIKALKYAQNNPLLTPRDYIKTSEGLILKSAIHSTEFSDLNFSKESLQKCNQTHIALLKNGYYEVNGFKFTEFYYNKLWQNGRNAPSLAAKAILDNATKVIPDPAGHSGFFKYFADGWEMVYNPITKIVSHIQPIKKKRI